jgi:branched-chain amino acid transport system permease protein
MDILLAQLVTGAATGSACALIAVAANLTYRAVRTVNFTQGPMMLVAALLTTNLVRVDPLIRLPGFLAGPLAALISLAVLVCVLVLTEAFIARPALRARGMLGWVFATAGIGIVLQGAAGLIWGSGGLALPDVILTAQSYFPLFGTQVHLRMVAIPTIAVAALFIIVVLLRVTPWSQASRAVSMNPDLAAVQGLPLPRIALLTSVASAALAGVGGLLLAQISGPIGLGFGLRAMMLGFIAAVLGGLSSTRGAIAGGLLVGLADTLIGGALAPSAAHAILLALLVLVLARRPQGLLGQPEIIRP